MINSDVEKRKTYKTDEYRDDRERTVLVGDKQGGDGGTII